MSIVRSGLVRLLGLFELIEVGVAVVGGAAAFIIMVIVTSDVIGRYVFNQPIAGVLETTEQLNVFLVYLGWAYCERTGRHVKMTILISRLPPFYGQVMDRLVGPILLLALMSLILWQSGERAIEAVRIREFTQGARAVPIYPARLVVPIAAALLEVRLVLGILAFLFPHDAESSTALSFAHDESGSEISGP